MKTLFDIRSEREPGEDHDLLLELGKDHCAYAFLHKSSNTIDQLQFLTFEQREAEEKLMALVDNIRKYSFNVAHVSSAFPQALLVPTKYFSSDYQMLDLVYDQHAQQYLHDSIPEWQMVNMFSLPKALYQTLQQSFSTVNFCHAYTPTIKMYNGYVADHQLMVHFTPEYFRVLLKKDAAIHLAQTYSYTSPLDVVYFLLKISYEFNLDQSSVYIILSGLIEKDSSMYTEVEQYFANVHFAHPPEIKLPDNNHPQYFFTSLYNLATCVS